jgi:hypothetical protein
MVCVSARLSKFWPTAQQRADDAQETLVSSRAAVTSALTGLGVGWIVHREPFHRSTNEKYTGSPPPS